MQFLINVALASQILLFFSPTTESLLSPLPLPLLDPSFLLSSSSELTAGIPIGDILQTSLQKAVKSGTAGATAAVFQVSSLMWLRTTLNYQYKYDLTTLEAMAELNKQGGFSRFYQGLGFAILQSPLSRFGDTAANSFILSLVDAYDPLFPGFLRTLLASIAAGGFRILLMPIDTCKTCLQVNGEKGLFVLLYF